MVIYTATLTGITDVIDVFESVIWNMQFYGPGDLELVVPATEKNLSILKEGVFLVRDEDVHPDGFDNVMRIEGINLSFKVEEGWVLTVTGKSLKHMTSQRVIWSQTNLSGSVEMGIRQVLTENIINPADPARAIPNFILEDANGFPETFEAQLLGENIAEWLEETCKSFGYGWDVTIRNGKYVFSLKKGEDRTTNQNVNVPVVFSPEYDNLITSDYSYDLGEFKNAALVGGEGEGANQRTASVGTASGLDRYEAFIDGSSVSSNGEIITPEQYIALLENYGQEQLNQTFTVEKTEGSVIPNGMYVLNEDYFLGDLVSIKNGFIEAQTRVIEIIYSEDENGWALTPTFSSWEEDD